MRILILGNTYSAKEFDALFKKDNSNIVFVTIPFLNNYIEFNDEEDIINFIEANEIDFVLITEEKYIEQGLEEIISEKGISAFSPSYEAILNLSLKSQAKKFMYKLKIQTPKFLIAQKPSFALDWIKENNYPFTIKPDLHNSKECSHFVETYKDAFETVNTFFNSGNKKIIIEDYIEGKNISIWVLSTGYSYEIIGISAKYQNEIAYMKPNIINEEIKNNIIETMINPVLNTLSEENKEYIGILGFDIIIDKSNSPWLIGFNSFFDDINIPFFINKNTDWLDIFNSTIIGDIFMKYSFKEDDKYKISYRENNEICYIEAKTKTNLKKYIDELDIENEKLKEAINFGIMN